MYKWMLHRARTNKGGDCKATFSRCIVKIVPRSLKIRTLENKDLSNKLTESYYKYSS